MRMTLLRVVLLMVCVWCFAVPVRAAVKRPLSPVHERRQEEKNKRKEVYGMYQQLEAAEKKKAEEERKAQEKEKKAAHEGYKVVGANTLDVTSDDKDASADKQGKAGKSPRVKKAVKPRVITIKPKK